MKATYKRGICATVLFGLWMLIACGGQAVPDTPVAMPTAIRPVNTVADETATPTPIPTAAPTPAPADMPAMLARAVNGLEMPAQDGATVLLALARGTLGNGFVYQFNKALNAWEQIADKIPLRIGTDLPAHSQWAQTIELAAWQDSQSVIDERITMAQEDLDALMERFDGRPPYLLLASAERMDWIVRWPLPEGFAHLIDLAPGIAQDARYAGAHNFMGRPMKGYETNSVVVSAELGQALLRVQDMLRQEGLGLLVYDAYRPQSAVDDMMLWSQDAQDTAAQEEFYPNLDKAVLFDGYIASRSGHTRGGAVDLTLIGLEDGQPLDMGGGYDLLDPISWIDAAGITQQCHDNRMKLNTVMRACGFVPYEREWWHFTLQNEPHPGVYYDFPIR